ncbi:MAG TPA: hypothetical protein VFV10_10300, partial [Gammaproteobacteria bacterium]|nr:hypothetical protein [Gammaproteobacteria bacterium]
MMRKLLVVFVVGWIVSAAAYSGARSLNPGLLERLECAVDGCARGGAKGTEPADAPDASLEREIDRYLAPLVATNNFYGTVHVARGGKVLVDKGYGSASI